MTDQIWELWDAGLISDELAAAWLLACPGDEWYFCWMTDENTPTDPDTPICESCKDIDERSDVPHVIRACPDCGREMHIVEKGKDGIGVKVREGDRFQIPSGWLKLSFDPTKSRGHFLKHGLDWFAKLIFMADFPREKSDITKELTTLEERNDSLLRNSDLLADLDIDDPDDGEEIFRILKDNQSSAEFWAMTSDIFIHRVNEAIKDNDAVGAAWATIGAERTRAMTIFKEHLENVVWMGHSAKRIVDILATWDNNRTNSSESFWQTTFKESPYVLSQIFASPMVLIQENASIAGMNVDRSGAKFVDYLFAMESSREAIAVEIKTPTTKLLGRKYRGVYPPSRDLSGAVVQVLDYRRELIRKVRQITEETNHDLESFDPKCAVIIGNSASDLNNEARRRSFELFQASQKDVEIVTYDNLFRKIEVLASLFNLTRSQAGEGNSK